MITKVSAAAKFAGQFRFGEVVAIWSNGDIIVAFGDVVALVSYWGFDYMDWVNYIDFAREVGERLRR